MEEAKSPESLRRKWIWRGGVIAFVSAAIISVALGVALAGKGDNARVEFNARVSRASSLFDAPAEARGAQLKESVSYYVLAGESSNDPVVRSAAYLNAGVLTLWDYEATLKESKEATYPLGKPSGAKLQSAIQYLEESARICGGQKDRDSCFFREIQTNLDYARLLWQGDKANAGSGKNPAEKENEALGSHSDKTTLNKAGERPRISGKEGGLSDEEGNPAESAREHPITGSIRGGHSSEPDTSHGDDPGDGSGFQVHPNKP